MGARRTLTTAKTHPPWLRKAGFSFREPGDRSERAAYGPAACATAMPAWIMPAWIMPRSGMTRPALTSPPTPVADARRDAVCGERHRERGYEPGPGLRQRPTGLPFLTLADDQRGPTAPRKGVLCGRPLPQGWRARPRRVVIIGCERRLFVNTLVKNWAMTVRQIGWLKVHPSHGQKTKTMIPSVASGVLRSPPWTTRAPRQRRNSAPLWAWHGGDLMDRPFGLAQAPPLAVRPVTGARLQGKAGRHPRTEESINSINKAPGGRWGRGSRVGACVARGIRYNWKGPPIELPPCAEVDPRSALNTV